MTLKHFALPLLFAFGAVTGCESYSTDPLQIVAKLDTRPGNVIATPGGRVFTTMHPLDPAQDIQLGEIVEGQLKPWPGRSIQANGSADVKLDTPLGISRDKQGGLWVVDIGFNTGVTRVFGFDIASGTSLGVFTVDSQVLPKGSFAQDLAVDRKRGVAYLADLSSASIVVLDLNTGKSAKISGHASLQAETDARMIINQKPVVFSGAAAEVAINPITLSNDNQYLYFGAMNGTSWYRLATKDIDKARENPGDYIERVGPKPISDGADTDTRGNHIFTNLNDNGLDMLTPEGKLVPVIRDPRLDWADNVRFDGKTWLYLVVNQLHKSTAFTQKADTATQPYYIYRIKHPLAR